jgi:hypothetical protein
MVLGCCSIGQEESVGGFIYRYSQWSQKIRHQMHEYTSEIAKQRSFDSAKERINRVKRKPAE